MTITVDTIQFQQSSCDELEVFMNVPIEQFSLEEICKIVGVSYEGSSVWLFDSETLLWIRIISDKLLHCVCNLFLVDGKKLVLRVQSYSSSPNQTSETIQRRISEAPSNSVEPFSQEKIEDLNDSDLVQIIIQGENLKLIFKWSLLLDYIKSQLSCGFSPYNVEVSAFVEAIDEEFKFTLTKNIWQTFLLRKHAGSYEYTKFLTDVLGNILALESSLKELHANTDLLSRIKVFHHDLCSFRQHEEKFITTHEMFMSEYYFSDEEREYLHNFPTSNGLSVREVFAQSIQNIMSSRQEFELCASHDIAPLVSTFFKLRKGYECEKGFQSYYKQFHKKQQK